MDDIENSDEVKDLALMSLTAQVVSAAIGARLFSSATEAGEFIKVVHGTFAGLSTGTTDAPTAQQEPAVDPKKSITKDFIICLEDGKKFKSLKRHLSTRYGLTPEEYREKWGLASDYPMVAPNYAAVRSELAKASGLGRATRAA